MDTFHDALVKSNCGNFASRQCHRCGLANYGIIVLSISVHMGVMAGGNVLE